MSSLVHFFTIHRFLSLFHLRTEGVKRDAVLILDNVEHLLYVNHLTEYFTCMILLNFYNDC